MLVANIVHLLQLGEVEDVAIVKQGGLYHDVAQVYAGNGVAHDGELKGAPDDADDGTDVRRRQEAVGHEVTADDEVSIVQKRFHRHVPDYATIDVFIATNFHRLEDEGNRTTRRQNIVQRPGVMQFVLCSGEVRDANMKWVLQAIERVFRNYEGQPFLQVVKRCEARERYTKLDHPQHGGFEHELQHIVGRHPCRVEGRYDRSGAYPHQPAGHYPTLQQGLQHTNMSGAAGSAAGEG